MSFIRLPVLLLLRLPVALIGLQEFLFVHSFKLFIHSLCEWFSLKNKDMHRRKKTFGVHTCFTVSELGIYLYSALTFLSLGFLTINTMHATIVPAKMTSATTSKTTGMGENGNCVIETPRSAE